MISSQLSLIKQYQEWDSNPRAYIQMRPKRIPFDHSGILIIFLDINVSKKSIHSVNFFDNTFFLKKYTWSGIRTHACWCKHDLNVSPSSTRASMFQHIYVYVIFLSTFILLFTVISKIFKGFLLKKYPFF